VGWIGEALAAAGRRLSAAGCDTPRLDAELLLAEVLDVDRARLVIDDREPLDPAAVTRFEALIGRREAREPVAYILGRRDFRRLTLHVDPRVLIPRPETEMLVEVALALAPGLTVLDIGTGSGAIALAVKDERPDLQVRGVDVSPGALAVARANAARLELEVAFSQGDLHDGQPADVVLANLPYVPLGARLEPEIVRYEPAGALFAGDDGLDAVRRLVGMLPPVEMPVLALEIGSEQADTVRALLQARGYANVEVRRDLAGHERLVVGRR
jgi:release factor glutamine methyltransferase